MNVFSETAMTTVRAQQVLAHGVVGGLTAALGGTNPTTGFVGAVAGKTMALVTAELLTKSGIAPGSLLYNQILALSASAAGAVVGGSTGGFIASQGDRFNRQLHDSEKIRIRKLAGVDKQKEARLTAAACALVKCYAEYPVDSLAYQELKKLADIGSTYTAEKTLLSSQTYGGNQIFGYSTTGFLNDAWKDSARRLDNAAQLSSRALGLVQGGIGSFVVASSIVSGVPACATVVGCAGVVGAGTLGADSLYTGFKQLIYGDSQATLLNSALLSLGMTPQTAAIVELTLGIGSGAAMANGLSKATAQAIAYDTALTRAVTPMKGLGVTVTPSVLATPEAQALANAVKAGNPTISKADLDYVVKSYIESGKVLPSQITVSSTTELIKVVPKGTGVDAYSGYWMTVDQAKQLRNLPPAQVANMLGIPADRAATMIAKGMDFYSITPKVPVPVTVFSSTVAPTSQGATGGAQQIIVANRTWWRDPVAINSNSL